MSTTKTPDATVVRLAGGSFCLVHLHSDEAKDWVRENVGADALFTSTGALAVEGRYVDPIEEAMQEDGLWLA